MQRLIILSLFFALIATAQDIPEMRLVGKPTEAEDEFVGIRDDDGDLCAAIKVISSMEGFRYTSNNGVVRVDDEPGKDMVFLSTNERVLEILHSGYKPMRIILHEIGIRLKGKQVWQIQIAGDRKQDPIPVTILTEPERVLIRVDGGKPSSDIQHLLVPGTHRLTAEKSGYVSKDTVVNVDRNNALVRVKLNELSQYGSLDIDIIPHDAYMVLVHERGQKFSAEGNHTFIQLPAGLYKYKLSHTGYKSRIGEITIKPGKEIRGEIIMEPLHEQHTNKSVQESDLKSKKKTSILIYVLATAVAFTFWVPILALMGS